MLFRVGLSMLQSKQESILESSDSMSIYIALNSGRAGSSSFELEPGAGDKSATSKLLDAAFCFKMRRKVVRGLRGQCLRVLLASDRKRTGEVASSSISSSASSSHAAEAGSTGQGSSSSFVEGDQEAAGVRSSSTSSSSSTIKNHSFSTSSMKQSRRHSELIMRAMTETSPEMLAEMAHELSEGTDVQGQVDRLAQEMLSRGDEEDDEGEGLEGPASSSDKQKGVGVGSGGGEGSSSKEGGVGMFGTIFRASTTGSLSSS